MSAELEEALIRLYTAADEEKADDEREMDAEQRRQIFGRDAELMSVGDALRIATEAASNPLTARDRRFATAQAFFLGSRVEQRLLVQQQGPEEVQQGLHNLASSLLRSVGANAAVVATRGEPLDPAGILVGTLTNLMNLTAGEGVTSEHLDGLQRAFGTRLEIVGTLAEGDAEFSGPAASLALLLLELFTNGLNCRARPADVKVGDEMKAAIFVEVDVCTNQPFAACKRGINPLTWDDCNPFFLSVEVQGSTTKLADGWAAVVKERVGCPFNGHVYETDLTVTMTEQEKMHTVAFDLVRDEDRTDPKAVTVDRGFVAAIDEGTHRRIRVLKVYRIEDLQFPQRWICPLWASQVAMSPWWCP